MREIHGREKGRVLVDNKHQLQKVVNNQIATAMKQIGSLKSADDINALKVEVIYKGVVRLNYSGSPYDVHWEYSINRNYLQIQGVYALIPKSKETS